MINSVEINQNDKKKIVDTNPSLILLRETEVTNCYGLYSQSSSI